MSTPATTMANESPPKKRQRKSSSASKIKMPPADMQFPPEVYTKPSSIDSSRLGIWCKEQIPKGRIYGPFQGRKVSYIKSDATDPLYVWEIIDKETREHLFYIDATDPHHSNWMRYMNCARYFEEQNVVSEQEDVDIFYRVIKDISPGEELLTWYEQPKIKRFIKQKNKRNSQGNLTEENTSGKSHADAINTQPPVISKRTSEKKLANSRSKPVRSITMPKRYSRHNVDKSPRKLAKSSTEKCVPKLAARKATVRRCSKPKNDNGEDDDDDTNEKESSVKRGSAPVAPKDVPEILVDGYFDFHIRTSNVINDGPNGVRMFTCDVCVAMYKHAFSLKRHFLRTHISNEFVSQSDRLNCNIASPAPLLSPVPDSGSDGIPAPADDIISSVERAFSDVHSSVSMTELAEASISDDSSAAEIGAEYASNHGDASWMHDHLQEDTSLSGNSASNVVDNQKNLQEGLSANCVETNIGGDSCMLGKMSVETIIDGGPRFELDTKSETNSDSKSFSKLNSETSIHDDSSTELSTNPAEACKDGVSSSSSSASVEETTEETGIDGTSFFSNVDTNYAETNAEDSSASPVEASTKETGIYDEISSSKIDKSRAETNADDNSSSASIKDDDDCKQHVNSPFTDLEGKASAKLHIHSKETSVDDKSSISGEKITKETRIDHNPSVEANTKENAIGDGELCSELTTSGVRGVDGNSLSKLDTTRKDSADNPIGISNEGAANISTEPMNMSIDLSSSPTVHLADATRETNVITQIDVMPKMEDDIAAVHGKVTTDKETNEKDKITYMECVSLNDAAKRNSEYRDNEQAADCSEPVTVLLPSEELNEANAAIFRCNLCAVRLATRCKLWQHLQEHTNNEHAGKVYTCALCGMTFSHRQNLARHRVVHAGARPYVCQFCGKRFPTATNRARHEHIHAGRRLSCALCSRTFTQASDVRRHVRRMHPSQHHECGVCGACFTTRAILQRHARCHADESPPVDESNFACTLCERRFHDYANMCRHRRLAHQKADRRAWLVALPPETPPPSPPRVQTPPKPDESFYANVSQLISDNLGRYIIGTRSHLDRPRTQLPAPKFAVESATNLALYNFPPGYRWREPAETTRRHQCSECGRILQNFKSYREHMYVRHRHIVDPTSTTDALKTPDDAVPKSNLTDLAQKADEFPRLDWTLGMHHKLYLCKACGEEFDSLETVTNHQNAQHANVWCSHLVVDAETRPLVWTRPTPVGLLRAVQNQPPATDITAETPDAMFKCTKCDSPHDSMQTLHSHIVACAALSRVGMQPPTKRSARTKRQYRKRQLGDTRTRMSSAESRRVGWIHKRGVYEPARHVRRRELMKPLEMARCGGCLRQFRSISLLERHAKVCSEKDRLRSLQLIVASHAPSSQNDDDEDDPEATYDPKKRTCIYCLRQFKYRGTLRVHVSGRCPRRQELLDAGDPIDDEWEASLGQLGDKSTENGSAVDGDKDKVMRKRYRRTASTEWKRVGNGVVEKEYTKHGGDTLVQSESAAKKHTDVLSKEVGTNGFAESAKAQAGCERFTESAIQNSHSRKTDNESTVPQKRSNSDDVCADTKRFKNNDGTNKKVLCISDKVITSIQTKTVSEKDDISPQNLQKEQKIQPSKPANGQPSQAKKAQRKKLHTNTKYKEGFAKRLGKEKSCKLTKKKGHPTSTNGFKSSKTNGRKVATARVTTATKKLGNRRNKSIKVNIQER